MDTELTSDQIGEQEANACPTETGAGGDYPQLCTGRMGPWVWGEGTGCRDKASNKAGPALGNFSLQGTTRREMKGRNTKFRR